MAQEKLKKVGEHEIVEIPTQPVFKGTFSKVYFGKFDDKEVAVKRVDREDFPANELELLRDFEHENIVRYLFTDTNEDFLFIVLEKCHCTLREFINEKKHEVPHLAILWQALNGLAYLHEIKNLIHRDLKPCNILLLFRDKKWVVKISDFGISKKLDPNNTKVTQSGIKGTIGYYAPETLKGEKISKHTDIFSLGIIFVYVLSEGEHPFGSDNLKVEASIRDGTIAPNLEILLPDFKHDAALLITSMIAYEPKDRPLTTELLAHHLFWDAEKKLSFIQEVSDFCITSTNFPVMSPKLEKDQQEVVGDWRKTIYDVSPVVKEEFESMRHKRQKDGVCDLLRNIRNLKNHYKEKPVEFHEIVGKMPDGLMEFFTTRFPRLISYVYDVLRCQKEESCFQKYYHFKGPSGIDLNRSLSRPETNNPDPDYLNMSDDITEKLVLRNYQWELGAQAMKGLNSLIVAPTGSGKTAVLAGIIEEHIKKNADEKGRIIFMVPKTALAHQQYSFMERYLSCTVGHIIGEFAPITPAGQKIMENKVTVLTAQILINELKRKPEDSYVTFDDISMLIFDECHNATKRHPYKQIMDLFFEFKESRQANPHHIQVVGVTASPGVGKAKDRFKVKENLLELLANLDITSAPSTVEINTEELKEHQNEILEYYIGVQTESEFGKKIIEVMIAAEEHVKEINESSDASYLNKIPKDRSKQAYEKWTDDLKQHAKLDMRDQESGRILITYAEHLKMYNLLLQLKDLVPNAMSHTNKIVTFQQEGFENKKLLQKNQALQKEATNVKVPMLERLFEIILKEFSKNGDARCIVFVKRKLTAKSLEECMAERQSLSHLNPRYLTGTHESEGAEAMTKVTQQDIITAFKDGETKVLIATSVAEEGLDIKECNLVIMYNYVTGEVGRIQRRGRGRASDSRAILITSIGSNHLNMEEDNKVCAAASDKAIEDVKKIPPLELEQQIKERQQREKAARKHSKEMKENAKKTESPDKWEILCAKCKNFLTTGDKLRLIEDMHVVVKDSGFESRVVRKAKEQMKGPSVHGTADFLCSNPKCGIKVALEMVYRGFHHPTLSIRKVLMRKEGGKLCDPKKRSLMPFTVTKSVDDSDEEENDGEVTVTSNSSEFLETSSGDDDNIELIEMMQRQCRID